MRFPKADASDPLGQRDLIVALTALALERAAPDELAVLDQSAQEYFADPDAVLNPKRRDEAPPPSILARDTVVSPVFFEDLAAQSSPEADYRDRVAPTFSARYDAIEAEVAAIDAAALAPAGRAQLVHGRIIAPLRLLLDDAAALTPATPKINAVHALCLSALRTAIAAFEAFATAYENNDSAAFAEGQRLRSTETQRWRAWAAATQAL